MNLGKEANTPYTMIPSKICGYYPLKRGDIICNPLGLAWTLPVLKHRVVEEKTVTLQLRNLPK